MTTYTELLAQFLHKQYPDHNTELLVITTLNFKIIPFKAQLLLQKYTKLKTMVLTHCDLRNLQNFPHLNLLSELDLSYNSLQGTLNFLMPCSSLKYLDLSNNLISTYSKLQPLRRLAGIEVCVKDNPFLTKQISWKNKIKQYSIKIAKQQRKLIPNSTPQQPKQEDIRPKRQDDSFILDNCSSVMASANQVKKRMYSLRKALNQENQKIQAQRRRQNLLEQSDSDELMELFQQEHSEILQDVFLDEGNIDDVGDSQNQQKQEPPLIQPEEPNQLGFPNPVHIEAPNDQGQDENQSSFASSS